MTTYVLLTLLVLAGPFILSFDKRVAFYMHWKPLFSAMIPVSAAYIIWDVLVTERGDWSFSPEYSGNITIFGLPLGEWLFFIVVPYACIFIFEVVRAYFPRKTYRGKSSDGGGKTIKSKNSGYDEEITEVPALVFRAGWTAAAILFFLAYIFRNNDYTVLALLSVGLWISLTLFWQPQILMEIHTLWYFGLSLIAFLLINGILTGLPIVLYNPEAIWGIRIITIPLEDVFYNISILGFYLTFYIYFSSYFDDTSADGRKKS